MLALNQVSEILRQLRPRQSLVIFVELISRLLDPTGICVNDLLVKSRIFKVFEKGFRSEVKIVGGLLLLLHYIHRVL